MQIHNITKIELNKALNEATENKNNKKTLFLDVRTPEEFELKSIPGFENIPINQIQQKIPDLLKYENIYVTCQSGGRSLITAALLAQSGVKNVYNLEDGVSGYYL